MIAATIDLNAPAPCAWSECDRPATRVYNVASDLGYNASTELDLCDRDGHIYEWKLGKLPPVPRATAPE
jgi:hypothetical protein